ncbi:MAG: 50S ribosomal protein L17 [Patescibacteria group bacterium]|nr:50S ribosomal protein L17 [Patescibacteria group bacterium]
MRHKVFGKKLNRASDQRQALFKNLAGNFFKNSGRIKTTLAKAKAVQGLIERMISRACRGDLASRRWLFKYFQDQNLVNRIVATFGEQFKDRPGGYLKIVRLKNRKGDNAVVVSMELVEKLKEEEKEAGPAKKTVSKDQKKPVKNEKK